LATCQKFKGNQGFMPSAFKGKEDESGPEDGPLIPEPKIKPGFRPFDEEIVKYHEMEARNLRRFAEVAQKLFYAGRKLPETQVEELKRRQEKLRSRFWRTNAVILESQKNDLRPIPNDGTIAYDALWNIWQKKYDPQDS
ncbi:MAG: hypothetical protein Q9160_004076, partial [Pyrenula sp. 1 TL-2023]